LVQSTVCLPPSLTEEEQTFSDEEELGLFAELGAGRSNEGGDSDEEDV